MDVLLPLTLSLTPDPAAALRLIEQHIAAAHGLSTLYIGGFACREPSGIDTVAADAAQITRTLVAAAQQEELAISINATPPAW